MAEENKNNIDPVNDENSLENSLSKTESIIVNNKKKITNILTGILVLLALVFFMKKQVWEPAEIEAKNLAWEAQYAFEKDSFQLAQDLFTEISEEFGGTGAGNGALLYKGISSMKLGQFEEAIENLKSFDAEGDLIPGIKNGLLGDCYSEIGDWEQAVDYYKKAGKIAKSEITSPYYFKKAGILLEQNNIHEDAHEIYEEILTNYYFEGSGKFIEERNEILKLNNRAQAQL